MIIDCNWGSIRVCDPLKIKYYYTDRRLWIIVIWSSSHRKTEINIAYWVLKYCLLVTNWGCILSFGYVVLKILTHVHMNISLIVSLGHKLKPILFLAYIAIKNTRFVYGGLGWIRLKGVSNRPTVQLYSKERCICRVSMDITHCTSLNMFLL